MDLNIKLYKAQLEMLNNIHPAIINNVIQTIDKYTRHTLQRIYFKQNRKFIYLQNKQYPNDSIKCQHEFYERVSNLTSIDLNNEETNILNKGLKYNIPYNNRNHIIQEIVNAEAAIKMVPDHRLQNETRIIVNSKLLSLIHI